VKAAVLDVRNKLHCIHVNQANTWNIEVSIWQAKIRSLPALVEIGDKTWLVELLPFPVGDTPAYRAYLSVVGRDPDEIVHRVTARRL
jgi:hypothetical protein